MRRILILDDDADIRLILKVFLERDGQTKVHEASDAAAGWALLQATDLDLVVLDQQLPDSSGMEVLQRIQRLIPTPPPVVVLTASRDMELRQSLLDQGARAVLNKPFDPAALVNELRVFLND